VLEQSVTSERNAVREATDHTFRVAVEGWRQGSQSLVVVLVSFPNGDVPNDFKARDAVIGACGAATRSAPRSMQSYAPIADSTEATCQGTSAAGVLVDAAVMAWRQGNIFVLTIGNQFATSQLEDFARAQHAALPAPPAGQSSGSSGSSNTELFVIIGIVAAIGVAVRLAVISRSRNQMPPPVQALSTPAGAAARSTFAPPTAPSPSVASSPFAAPSAPVTRGGLAPGWQPVDGDPTRIAYWDGTRFTAWKRWDGANWVD